jgi:hypothetical protein
MVIMKAYWKCLCDQGTATDFKKGCPIHDPALKVANYTDYAALQQRVKELEAELETERLRLAGVGVVAQANTQESAALCRVPKDSPYYSASMSDVEAAVDREMALRAENQRMIDIAGEALSTQPEQRGPDTVEVLANHARRLAEEIVRLRDEITAVHIEIERLVRELKQCNRSRKWWKDLAYAAGGEKISCRAATIKALGGGE